MTTPPTFAAIIVNYNYAPYVLDAITSILQQSSPFDEVLIVDDGSTDDSIAVIRASAPAVQLIQKPNGGPLSAVFAGLRTLTSDYVYVLDADDVADLQLVETIKGIVGEGVVKVQFQLRAMAAAGTPTESVFPSYSEGYGSRRMIHDNERLGFYVCAPTSGNVFRRDFLAMLLNTGLLDERGAFDGVPAQLAPYFGAAVSLNRPLAKYRVHDRSLSQYGNPTPALMERELDRFAKRWTQALAVLRLSGIAHAEASSSAYVLERQLMKVVLEDGRPRVTVSVAFAALVLGSGLPLRQRLLLAGWGVALALLPKSAAKSLVRARRSPRQRGPLLRWIAQRGRKQH